MTMSEFAAMKRRVRGVLRKNRLEPLLASALALVPCAAAAVLFLLLVWPRVSGSQVVDLSALRLTGTSLINSLLMAAAMLGGGLDVNWQALGGAALAGLVPFAVWAFAALPMRVAVSGYYMALLRGKKTSPLDVFSCFGERYTRYLCGMLFNALWLCLWAAAAVVLPVVMYVAAQPVIPKITEALHLINSWYVWLGVLGLCALWFVVFTVVFVNRAVAYSFTPLCLAAHPRLPARRAPRLSRMLARGCKRHVVSLFLTFALAFVPAVACAAVSAFIGAPDVRRILLLAAAVLAAAALAWAGPYYAACRRAFYIERKREALWDNDVTPDDFGRPVKPESRRAHKKTEEEAQ